MFPVDWNALIRHIERSLPGRGLWMQCIPVFDQDKPTEEGVGLAIQREEGPRSRWYTVLFFTLRPTSDAVAPDGQFLPGRGDNPSDWTVDVSYDPEFEDLGSAKREARSLAQHLPKPYPPASPNALLNTIDALEDYFEDTGETEAGSAYGAA